MRKLIILLVMCSAACFAQSETYPHPANESWHDLLLWSQPKITASTSIPITAADDGDLWFLASSTAAPKLYRYTSIATTTAGWREIGGGTQAAAESDPILYAGEPSVYTVNLATNTITNLHQICSFTVPCQINLYHYGTQFQGAAGAASATVGAGIKWADGDKHSYKPASSSFNAAFIASSTVSALKVEVFPLVELAP